MYITSKNDALKKVRKRMAMKEGKSAFGWMSECMNEREREREKKTEIAEEEGKDRERKKRGVGERINKAR